MKSVEEGSGSKDLPEDIWVNIFSKLEPSALFEGAYSVSRPWRSICRLILFWDRRHRSINLQKFKEIRENEGSRLVKLLDLILDDLELKSQSPPLHLYLPLIPNLIDNHLLHIATRLPRLQTLELSCISMLTKAGFSRAISCWTEIENLTIGPMTLSNYIHVIQDIGINCKNLHTLCLHTVDAKVGNAFVLDESTSLVIANNLPHVKTLMFKHFMIYKLGIHKLLNKSPCLESVKGWKCRHAHSTKSNDKYHCTIKGCQTFTMSKSATRDNAWSVDSCGRRKKLTFNSYSSMISYLWIFDLIESDNPLEWFPKCHETDGVLANMLP